MPSDKLLLSRRGTMMSKEGAVAAAKLRLLGVGGGGDGGGDASGGDVGSSDDPRERSRAAHRARKHAHKHDPPGHSPKPVSRSPRLSPYPPSHSQPTSASTASHPTTMKKTAGDIADGGDDGSRLRAGKGEVAPRMDRDDPAFENWMYLEGPCGVWSNAQRDGVDEGLTKQIVRAAGFAWAGGHTYNTPETRYEDIESYLVWVMQRAHIDSHAKMTALRIMSHLPDEAEPMLTRLKARADSFAAELEVKMEEHTQAHDLIAKLGRMAVDPPVVPSDAPPPPPLSQELYFAPYKRHLQREMQKLLSVRRPLPHEGYRTAMLRALIIVAHFLDEEVTAMVDKVVASAGVKYKLRDVPPKLFARMRNKLEADHAADIAANPALSGCTPGCLNLDVVRKAVSCATAEEQLALWDAIKDGVPGGVLRIKNHFRVKDSGTRGMRFALLNVPYVSTSTWASMVTTQRMRFDRAVENAYLNNVHFGPREDWKMVADALVALVDSPFFRVEKHSRVSMVIEIQLHLDFFVHCRKKTHFWFKIQRAESVKALRTDTLKFHFSR